MKQQHCLNENNTDQLLAYFDGTLPEAECRALDAHAARCADCRALLSVHTQLDDFTVPEVSSDFDAKLYARIAADTARPWWHFSSWSNWKLVVPVAGVAVMLAIGMFVAPPTGVDDNTVDSNGTTQTKAEAVDPQLEQALDDLELLMPLTSAQL